MPGEQTIETARDISTSGSAPKGIIQAISAYWNEHIHDLVIARHPVGTREFFEELESYRFEKLHYLPRVVDFSAYKGKLLLEVGCGLGIDLARFAKHGAIVTGIDLAETSIHLAKKNFELQGLRAGFLVMNGEHLQFSDGQFDVVYAHGVLQYTSDTEQMIREIYRVLRPGGEAILMVYNRYSWLNLLSKLFGVKLEHEDAPVLKKYSIREFRRMLSHFSKKEIIVDRFPVRTHLHRGMKAAFYNTFFVGTFNLIPSALVRPFGWHIMAKVIK